MIERLHITDEAEWLSWRDQDVTATQTAQLFGLDERKDKTPAALYWEKRGVVKPVPDSDVLRRGKWLEDSFPKALRDERPAWQLTKAEHYYRDPAFRLGATPDFYVEDTADRSRGFGVLEAKTTEADVFERWWGDTPPPWVTLQAATQMLLTGFAWGVVACLVLGFRRCEMHLYPIDRNQAAEQKICDRVAEFWRHVDEGIEPPLNYARDAGLIPLLYPNEQPGKVVDLTGDNRLPELLEARKTLTTEIALRDKAKKEIETEIRAKIGDAERALVPGWRVTFKMQQRKEIEATEFRVLRTRKLENGASATN